MHFASQANVPRTAISRSFRAPAKSPMANRYLPASIHAFSVSVPSLSYISAQPYPLDCFSTDNVRLLWVRSQLLYAATTSPIWSRDALLNDWSSTKAMPAFCRLSITSVLTSLLNWPAVSAFIPPLLSPLGWNGATKDDFDSSWFYIHRIPRSMWRHITLMLVLYCLQESGCVLARPTFACD